MDRIFEAYNGGMGVEMMRKSRERLSWLCSRTRGAHVLDVGCSQGVLPILLGRSGFVVHGLDINPEAIEYATNELQKELPSVQKSVTFSVANFAQTDFSDAKYDTVIMGEVLEHLPRPDKFISKAFESLQDKGLLLITVPFGINDDPDHRQTFYLSKIRELLAPFFLIKEEMCFGGRIGFAAERRKAKVETPPIADFRDLVWVEDAVFKRERILVDRIAKLSSANAELARAKAAAEGEAAKQKAEAAKSREEAAKLTTDLAKATSERKCLESANKELSSANAELARAKAAAEGEAAKSREEAAKQKAEAAKLTTDLANEKAWAAKHMEEFEQFLKETEAEKKSSEQRLSQEAQINSALKRERDALAKRYKKLSESKLGRLTLAYWKFKDGRR